MLKTTIKDYTSASVGFQENGSDCHLFSRIYHSRYALFVIQYTKHLRKRQVEYMLMRTNSLETCIYITVMVFILVVLMPAIDIFVCEKPAPSKQFR